MESALQCDAPARRSRELSCARSQARDGGNSLAKTPACTLPSNSGSHEHRLLITENHESDFAGPRATACSHFVIGATVAPRSTTHPSP